MPHPSDTAAAEPALPRPPLPPDPRGTALFFDFDGTLAPIVNDPARSRVPQATLDLLARLRASTGGAVAIVSGRPLSGLDPLLAPLVLPLAGVHGRQRRDAAGRLLLAPAEDPALRAVQAGLAAFAAANAGTAVEPKPGAVALHYRRRPELAGDALDLARSLAACEPGLRLIEGKMVVEFCLGAAGKGEAVAAFMEEPPFAGRVPLFFGDDVTDEDAYPVVDAAGGLSVRIGPGATRARHRLAGIDALRRWLARLAQAWDGAEP